ncbi:MAG: hypothetical protein HY961_04765 [Ignavibacteriae bacterium]|nr:hypothetical protein [Ignavibacteriota bacterium]
MAKVKEQSVAYRTKKPELKVRPQYRRREFIHDDRGKRIGVILDLATYNKMVEAQEDLDDIRDFKESAEQAMAEYRGGDYVTLLEYKHHRKAKRK